MVKFSYGTITSATIVKTALNFLPAKVFIRSCTRIEINTSFRSSIDISQKQAGCDNSIIEALCLIFAPGIVQETLAMIVARLEHFQSGLVLQIRHFDLLLQFDVLLLSLVEFHDFDALLLHQTTLLDVEFLFRLKESWEGGKKAIRQLILLEKKRISAIFYFAIGQPRPPTIHTLASISSTFS